ncbi:hypothetical protein DFJ73DRAFT_876759 [Zopfochytrium polystomum]|nr:hypothetical protein DFJ73DRAFT_876759 [Zopfochytrium polystomum]
MILPHSVVVDFVNKSLKGDTRTNLDDLLWNTLKVRSSTKSPSNPATTISVDEIGPAQRREVPSGPPSEDYLDCHVSEGLAILNYTSGSPRGHPVADHCRGLILDLGMLQNGTRSMTNPGRGSSPIVAACMPRYFNYGESFRWPGNGTEESLPIAQPPIDAPCLAVEKLDGTYIQVFRWNGHCELSTRGTIGGGAFRAPFLKALRRASAAASCADDEAEEAFFQRSFSDAFDAFDIHTLWFEYTSPNNQIVTLYSDERATLLGGFYRNGKELSRNDIGELKATPAFSQTAVCIPIMFPSTVETLRKSFGSEQQADAADDKNHGSNVEEGFVVYIGDRRWKVKNPKWVLLHEWRFNLNPTKILENIFTRKDDLLELIATVPEEAVIYDPYFKMIDTPKKWFKTSRSISSARLKICYQRILSLQSKRNGAPVPMPISGSATLWRSCVAAFIRRTRTNGDVPKRTTNRSCRRSLPRKLDLPEEVLIWYLYRGTRGVRDEAGKVFQALIQSFTLVVADDLDGGASTSNI